MVSTRCKLIVELEFKKVGLNCTSIHYGEVEIEGQISQKQIEIIGLALSNYGLELLNNKKSILCEKIKNIIVEVIYHSDNPEKTKFPEYLSARLNYDYTYLANVFSEVQGTNIEQFIILHKIQFVKQLIRYNELNLTEISRKLHYSSVAHLSTQFKKITGMTPTYFRLEQKQVKTCPETADVNSTT